MVSPVPLARISSQVLRFKDTCSTRQDTISSFNPGEWNRRLYTLKLGMVSWRVEQTSLNLKISDGILASGTGVFKP
jgi:hypothetical protein